MPPAGRGLVLALSLAGLALAGCSRLKQPKEFKNRKSKEDPPILDHSPLDPSPVQVAALPQPERI